MDTMVIRVADFKSEVKWPVRSLGGCHGLGGRWRQYSHGYQGNQGCWCQIWSQMTSKVIQSGVNWDHTAPHTYISLPLSPQVYRAIALLFLNASHSGHCDDIYLSSRPWLKSSWGVFVYEWPPRGMIAHTAKVMPILMSVLVLIGFFLTSCVGINLGDIPRGLRHPRDVPRLIPSHSVGKPYTH